MNALTIIILVLLAGLVILFINNDSGTSFGIANEEFAQLIYLSPIAALLGVGILAGNKLGIKKSIQYLLLWGAIIFGLITAYTYRYEFQSVGNRVMASLLPGSTAIITNSRGETEILLSKDRNNHYVANLEVDGYPIKMLVDTGASSVVLTHDDAKRIGINTDELSYSITVSTANGTTSAARTRLNNISLGPISRNNISALVAQDGAMRESLLGMSFINTLSSFHIRNNELILKD